MGLFDGLKKKVEGVVAQVNPLDGGRTYQTVMQRGAQFAPRPQASAFNQLSNSGPANFIRQPIHQVSTPQSGVMGFVNQAPKIASSPFQPQYRALQGTTDLARAGIGALTHNPIAAHNALNAAKQDYQAIQHTAQAFLTKPIAETATTVSHPFTQHTYQPTGGLQKFAFGDAPIQNVQKKVANNYQTHSNLSTPARIGLAGAEGLASLAQDAPVATGALKGVKVAARNAKPLSQVAHESAAAQVGLKPHQIINDNEANTLRDYADAITGSKVANVNQTHAQARAVGNNIGLDLTSGNPHDRVDRIYSYLQQLKDYNNHRNSMLQGGYAKIPTGKGDPAPDLHPEQKQFINEYANMLESMGQGNGVNITADGRRVSNNVRSAADKGRSLTKADWFERARAEIESGKAGYGASDEYKRLPSLQPIQADKTPELLPNAESNVFAQNPLRADAPTPHVSSVGDVLSTRKAVVEPQTKAGGIQLQSRTPDSKMESSLPILNTKMTSKLDKALRSTRSIIERQGEHGKALGNMLQGARDSQELTLAQWQKALPTVTKIARKDANRLRGGGDYENFVNATQGLEQPRNTKVAQAVQEWQALHPTIRQRGVSAGLDIGDLGPQYYPHFIDYEHIFKDTNTYNKAINHLVETGQAVDQADAIKKLNYAKDVSRNREFGNLEASRLLDLPFYDKTPNSLISYLNGSAKRIAQTETFGKQDERALDLITKLGKQGYDTEAAKNAYDVAVGAKQYNPNASAVSGAIRKYITTTRLGLGALTNVSQNVNTGIVTGHLRTMGAALKQLDPKTRAFVGDTGVIADAVLNDLKGQAGYSSFSQKVLGKGINKITAPGFGTVEKMNRSIAATAGRDYALRLAQKGDEATLRNLGVKGPIQNKTLTEAQQIQAARKVVEKTQFKVDPQDLPGWADSPGGKLVSQFRTFSYKQGEFVANEILKPAAHGNLMPLGRFLTALPLGYALYETKRVIAGRPEEENKGKIALQTAQNIGGLGLAFDLYQSMNPLGSKYIPSDRRTSMTFGALGGPAVGVGAQGIGAVSDLIQRKNTPVDESRLKGKVVIGKTPDSYTDATPAARFALQQVPIVGTAIKNRVLPFTTESNADAGKLASSPKSSGSNSADKLTVDQRLKQSFTKPVDFNGKQVPFGQLKESDMKTLAETDPNARAMLRDYQAAKKAFGPRDVYTEKNDPLHTKAESLGLTDSVDAYLKASDRFTGKGKDSYLEKPMDTKYQNIYDQASRVKIDGMPDLPKTNGTVEAYLKYLSDSQNGSAFKQNQMKRDFLKTAYQQSFPKEIRDIKGGSTNEILGALKRGDIQKESLDKAVALDNMLFMNGITTSLDIPKTLRKALGYGIPDGNGGSGGSGGKGKKGKGFNAIALKTTPISKESGIQVSRPSGQLSKKPGIKIASAKQAKVRLSAPKIKGAVG
jgi:hypothetical protein